MLERPLRQAAALVLESAIRIAPPDTREWGQAMRSELGQVEGPWEAILWALGSSGVLVKHAIAALLVPGRRDVPFGEGLFARSVSIRKVALAVGGVSLLATLIFLAAPPFRQGLRVSLTVWNQLFQEPVWSPQLEPLGNSQPGLGTLARRAEAQHDPQALAFVAARLLDARESARLAEEAVRLDPDFVWVYAVVAARHPELAEIHQWIPRLQRWDPQNALLDLITAESIDTDLGSKSAGAPLVRVLDRAATRAAPTSGIRKPQDDPAWHRAMAAAFASPKFDDYLDRLKELDGKVVRKYGLNDPYAVLFGEDANLPGHAFSDSQQFAKVLVESGDNFEARGDPKRAAEE
jgi:hypothetical protein